MKGPEPANTVMPIAEDEEEEEVASTGELIREAFTALREDPPLLWGFIFSMF